MYLCAVKSKDMAEYKQRIADIILERKVLGKGAVLIEGPKWCGKTTTAANKFVEIRFTALSFVNRILTL